jgi:hypothetical protein
VSKGPYISRLCAWAPGIENSGEWDEWAQGKRDISSDTKGPVIDFTDSMFRRRLSQISKMTVQVVHDLLPVGEDTKIFFVSFRGELSRQYQVNKMLIEEKSLMPAAFSLSVFNAPAALASIAFGLKGGYSALYPGNNSFAAGLAAAEAALLSDKQEELIFVYADEEAPPEYERCFKSCPLPLAFAFLLTREPQPLSVPLSSLNEADDPSDFLRLLLRKMHAAS